ncbi:MAG TPA: DNA polymerase Y family protein [Oleiagrimonas sp.]|nr:DNA polymerase Y family protein [Oleiagrimonas sp.]
MLWACVLLPSLALDSVLRGQPAPDHPLALVHGPAQQRRLVAVNLHARAAGLAPGQRLAEAQAVCLNLTTATYEPGRTRASLTLVAAWAYRYSAQVLLDPPRAIMLEVGKSMELFGPWPDFEARLRADLLQLGFAHRIALAPTPRAAHVLARQQDGSVVTTPEALPESLAAIAVTRAGLPDKLTGRLADMGMHRLGDLLALPRAALQRRFGKTLVEALDELLGKQPHALAAYQPPDRFTARTDLGCEVKQHQALLFPLRRMLSDLATTLAARDGGVERFVVRFGHMDAPPTALAIGLLAPERAADALFEVTRLRLEQTRLPHPVLDVSIAADDLPPFVPAARDLFTPHTAHALPWPQLCNRLHARLGNDAVYQLRVDPDPRPEAACVRDDATPATDTSTPPRPTWLLPRPIPLRGPAPTVLAGPERLETGWWDGGDIRRDYYVLELATGQRAWAFCAPGTRGPYMLHGWFA